MNRQRLSPFGLFLIAAATLIAHSPMRGAYGIEGGGRRIRFVQVDPAVPATPDSPPADLEPPAPPILDTLDEDGTLDDLAQLPPEFAQPAPFSALLLAAVPNMIGDFFSVSGARVAVTGPIRLTQMRSDNLFVTNRNDGLGADPNPAVAIDVFDGSATGPLITSSIGPGVEVGGQLTYPVDEPNGLRPAPPVAGTVNFVDANIAHTGPGSPVGDATNWNITANFDFVPDNTDGLIFLVPPIGGAATRRVKLAENNSPRPQNRLFFNYNYFDNVIAGLGDVSRYTLGFESTYQNGRGSIEMRFPLAGTLASSQSINSLGDRDAEFGNIAAVWKHVFWENENCLLSAGCGASLPTADDSRLKLADGTDILHVKNQAVHVLPFVALMSASGERYFWQSFVQLDIDTNGNSASGDLTGANMTQIGVIQDATLLFVDVGGGFHLMDNPYGHVRRLSALAEVHYSATLQDEDFAVGNGFVIAPFTNRFDVVNLTLGLVALVGDHTTIRPAMVIPLGTGDNRHFDYEAALQVNMYF